MIGLKEQAGTYNMEYNEKQIQIIDSAEKLFSSNGFEGTSVRDIAHEAGINIAMISYYFGSKEKLMEAVFQKRTLNAQLRVENLMQNEALSPIQKVFTLIDDYVEKILGQPEFHKIMMREQMLIKNSTISGAIFELKKRNLEYIKKLINEGQKTGAFKRNIDVALMMGTLTGTANNFICSESFYKSVYNMEDRSEEVFQRYMKKKLSHHLKTLFKATLTYDA
ncbi:MAG: TetR/AcrR family transcriptional regulator [Flavipsychrobacter sp.]|nr:TetR/AcrR family transcriptional regulator [Flavipsychrobacter sp.]